MNTRFTLALAALFISTSAFAGLSENKEVVTRFYDMAFNQNKAKEAALKYLTEEYIQHNPHVASGRQAFIDAFANEKPAEGEKTIFKRTIAEGDLVVLHSYKIRNTGDRGVAGIDIFRVKNGKITEHWDVNQPIPEKSANDNTMF